ncbi:hypothetical protein N7516_001059 [Penicillium verrucosum]|uniref:uncharacterized protein n=1 Tax=Penicillium verrucosum TaxID=60171 RepID=UPI002544D8F3|nr:uncharacterized protein N7516_001059 [Penicillium verrucosum]KAJ5940891.1 hypothetical protein N7516_001059 [Penicillium verrucosum]
MGDGSDYPSPRSEGPNGALAASILASTSESTPPIARMNDPQQPMSYNLDGARPRLSVRRARDPPKNSEGQIFCDHPECQAAPPTFRRPCEWNKHMDKHDRPYKCYEPNCDKIQGFTYSGGLLRHQREVHKKNTDTKKALISPMVDMSWDRATELDGVEGVRAPSLPITGMKRRHDTPPVGDLRDMPETDEHGIDLHNEVKRLRREVQEKDRRLEELERIVTNIQQAIPQQSPPGPELQDLSQPTPQPTAAPV